MSGSGVPLAIVPSGTGNLLARNLRLPLDDGDTMVAAAFDGDVHPIDVGIATIVRPDGDSEKRAFVVMGGIGLDAAMIANTSGDLKKKFGWVAYVDGAAKSLMNAKPFPIMYQVPGHKVHRANVQSVVFANCGSLPAGLELIPEASIADGALDIAIFQPKTTLGWLLVWRRVAWDNSVLRRFRTGRQILALRTKDNAVRYMRGGGIDIATVAVQPVQLDGDEFGEATHVTVRVEPACAAHRGAARSRGSRGLSRAACRSLSLSKGRRAGWVHDLARVAPRRPPPRRQPRAARRGRPGRTCRRPVRAR